VTLRLVAPDAAEPAPATRALIAQALGLVDWPAVLAALETTRQEVRHWWEEVTHGDGNAAA
jgi:glutamate-ammonia-ligase adenylyltransferase